MSRPAPLHRTLTPARSRGAATLLALAAAALAGRAEAAGLARLALPEPIEAQAPTRIQQQQALWSSRIDPALAGAQGTVDVWVKLSRAPVAEANGEDAKTRGGLLSPAQRRSYARSLELEQDGVAAVARALGGEELGRVSRAHNAVAIRIDASLLQDLATSLGVDRVRPVNHYELALSSTVPYVGAAAAQAAGKDGSGTRVAVLDSGIDYTHHNLGGPGTTAAYAEAVASFPNPYFPSAKVIGGFDFVGPVWPGGARAEDPNPIDDGPAAGHGTHVADIIGGRSADGAHVGVAPGTQLYAVKVCSSVATSCNGVALLRAVDFALDPDGDGTLDPVDVMNLSLGSGYGMKEDDLTEALERASAAGVVVVAAAGNDGNKPYVVSSPSIAQRAISVAQTQVPGATVIPLVVNAPAAIAGTYGNTEQVSWAPVDHAVTGDVVFVGRGCPAGSISATSPDDTYLADPNGKVALIDRGACAVSLKVDRAARAGATAVLIGLVAAGDAISFSFGGGTSFVPTLVITRTDANRLKANLGAPPNVTVSPANAIPLVGSIVTTSARGPSSSYQTIKPEIGAPGASVSAVAGTGTGESAFGGTSGATPMVAGSAAILVGANPRLRPVEVKAILMNSAETTIYHQPALFPGKLAPVTRIGAGEVRVNKALGAKAAAWVKRDSSAAISFGYRAFHETDSLSREVHVENLTGTGQTWRISAAYRTPGKAANAAVRISTDSSVRVPARSEARFDVKVTVDPALLPSWTLDGGPSGGNGLLLDEHEVDGYLTLTSGAETLTLPWHVLPHKAAKLNAPATARAGGSFSVENGGAEDGLVEVFALTGQSPRIDAALLPAPGDNFAVVDLSAVGVRAVTAAAPGDTLQVAVSTFGARAHPNYPAEFDIYIDSNLDGVPDYVVYNTENGGFVASGQNVVFVVNLATGIQRAFFFTDADLDSSNAILTFPAAAVGLAPGQGFDFSVYAFDNYFTGALTDAIENMVYTPGTPRWVAGDIAPIAPGQKARVSVTEVAGGAAASPSQTGFLLQYRHSAANRESQAVLVR
ncbi:MAG: S8 family serine peptidase [Deltaproteobacteria bacterium]|nr:S8 family serine peptidase [Deltaproteobacteria bacterium]